jgi:hypothetical protein
MKGNSKRIFPAVNINLTGRYGNPQPFWVVLYYCPPGGEEFQGSREEEAVFRCVSFDIYE